MKRVRIAFEFSKQEKFAESRFENRILAMCRERGIRISDFQCVTDKTVFLPDFPVGYITNECRLIIDLNAREDTYAVYSDFMGIIDAVQQEECFYNVTNVKLEEVKVSNAAEKQFTNKRVFVTGVTGQLGHDVINRLYEMGYEPIGSGMASEYIGIRDESPVTKLPYVSLDITDHEKVERVITEINPAVVIHCAAWNDVDRAESKKRICLVRQTNAGGTQSIADTCARIDAKMVYISTDYVFDGTGNEPWKADAVKYGALNVYGQTKLEGELAVSETLDKYFIIRTSWAYGINGQNFVKTMLDVSKRTDHIQVVNDQIGTPTYTKDLAELIVDMIATDKYGYYNATNEGGYVSWYDFACEIFKQAEIEINVTPVSAECYGGSTAQRPYNSRLDKSKLAKNGFKLLPDWKDALGRYLREC